MNNMSFKTIVLIVTLLITSSLRLFCQESSIDLSIRKCHSFSLIDFNGDDLIFEEMKGKCVVINYIGNLCIQPQFLLQDLAKFSNQFDEKDAVFIAVNGTHERNVDTLYKNFENSNYHFVKLNPNSYRNNLILFSKKPVSTFNIIIDKEGNIAYTKNDYFTHEQYADFKKRIKEIAK